MRQSHDKHKSIQFPLNHSRCALWLLAVATLLLAGMALAGTGVPGHGTCTGNIILTPISGGKMEIQINTTGNITHLGKSTVSVHSIADFTPSAPTPVPPSTGRVKAANGDLIFFTLRWTAQAIDSGVFNVTGPFDVTGGTGRFNGIGGTGTYRGRIDIQTGQVTAEIDGLLVR
ncbi:MAG: hypothetical protein AB9869_34895 [Verrucomicrobiia bacterium]